MTFTFDPALAFSRNLSWITEVEAEILRGKRVAIAGLGGVGGHHIMALTRLGVGKFSIADFDVVELPNFNRQACATVSHLNRPKIDVIAEMAHDINPCLDIRTFPSGIDDSNIDAFLDDVDLYVDGLDFFVLDVREKIFARCAERGIPAMTTGPLGMGAAHVNFLPGQGMSFKDYFDFQETDDPVTKNLKFLLGIAPGLLHAGYIAEAWRTSFAQHAVPSTPMGCYMCAGVAGTEALKVLLGRPGVKAAPTAYHYDAYRQRYKKSCRILGNRNPINRLILKIARAQMKEQDDSFSRVTEEGRVVDQILDYARWAPSGDNTQPWHFSRVDEDGFDVYLTRPDVESVFEPGYFGILTAFGTLIENIHIAATHFGRRVQIHEVEAGARNLKGYHVTLIPDETVQTDPLFTSIKTRSVARFPYTKEQLTDGDIAALQSSVGPGYTLMYTGYKKGEFIKLSMMNSYIRTFTEESYKELKRTVAWGKTFSKNQMPGKALGINPGAQLIASRIIGSWPLFRFFNRYLMGYYTTALEVDILPNVGCAGHVAISADRAPETPDDYIAAGRAVQRFWLTATRLGIRHQPCITPISFYKHGKDQTPFAQQPAVGGWIATLNECVRAFLGVKEDAALDHLVWMGRVGKGGKMSRARSVRKSVAELTTGSV